MGHVSVALVLMLGALSRADGALVPLIFRLPFTPAQVAPPLMPSLNVLAQTLLLVTAGSTTKAPVKLIIDTDLGSDVSNLISVCSANAVSS
jgi:hypothetical protein